MVIKTISVAKIAKIAFMSTLFILYRADTAILSGSMPCHANKSEPKLTSDHQNKLYGHCEHFGEGQIVRAPGPADGQAVICAKEANKRDPVILL